MPNAGLRSYTTTWRVRSYELDANGHVNNAVYVAYAEEVANQHAESNPDNYAGATRSLGLCLSARPQHRQ